MWPPLRVARTCAWLAIAGVVIAAAEPSIQPAPRQRGGILELVVDRSGSTAANDLAPTRLGAIQQATLALLDRVPERTRVGLVAFSDKAATLVRPTTVLRRHGELGGQRWEELRRRRLNQVGPLQIQVCRGCLSDWLGDATTYQFPTGDVSCDIRLDLAVVESTARGWGLPVTQVVATLLLHEQEHCIRDPDDRETPAIDAEQRLARKLGGARLLEFVVSRYRELDSSGHWRT